MQEQRRIEAVHELLKLIEESPHPASELINTYTRSRRYIGSKDRRFIADLVWKSLRYKAHLNFLHKAPETLLTEDPNDTPDMPLWVRLEVPEWIIPLIPSAENELKAMISPAPTILRTHGNRDEVRQKLLDEGINTEPTKLSPIGLVLKKKVNLNTVECYKNGLIEVQDEGSQLITFACDVSKDKEVFDMCAGAGGKTLLLSDLISKDGIVYANDISSRSLKELEKRAERAHAKNIRILPDFPTDKTFETVVVDAPCSGTGTWRRCPDAKWKITKEVFQKTLQKQQMILDKAVTVTEKKLCYMTCSLTYDENEGQIISFLRRHGDEFSLVYEHRFSPFLTGTDGFYIAVLVRK